MRSIYLIWIIYCIHISFIFSKPYLNIQQIRSLNYPYIQAELSVSKIIPIHTITTDHIQVYENGWRVSSFQIKKTSTKDIQKNIILVIDSSKSLTENYFQNQIKAVDKFIQTIGEQDKASIISFDSLVKKQCGFTQGYTAIKECLSKVRRTGNKTRLYDAVQEAIRLSKELSLKRHMIIVFTDGKDDASNVTLHDILYNVREVQAPIFTIATGSMNNAKVLNRLSQNSGGQLYHLMKIEEFNKVSMLLGHLMNNTYLLQYISHGKNTSLDLNTIDLKIILDTPNLQDEDSYSFKLPNITISQKVHAFIINYQYILYAIGIGFLFFCFLLSAQVFFLKLFKKNQVEVSFKNTALANNYKTIPPAPQAIPPEIPISPFKNTTLQNHQIPIKNYVLAYLVEKQGPNTGIKYKIQWNKITLGCSDENSIVISDPHVSEKHAQIEYKNQSFILYDLISDNGTYLNNQKILRPKPLNDFDEIEIGRTKLIFRQAKISKKYQNS